MTVKCVVPLSGGKDSQASLKLALTMFAPHEIRGLFCDTQWEHPITYAHVFFIECFYGIEVDTTSGGNVLDKCVKHGRFPGGGARHCTEELKIRETKIYCKALAEKQGCGFEVWYGMRSEESTEREKRYAGKVGDDLYAPHEVMKKYPKYLAKLGVMFRLCILSWTEADVFDYLEGMENPLYSFDFTRVGCFPCLAAGDATKERAFSFDDFGRSQYQKVIMLSRQIGKNVFTSKGGIARHADDNPGCSICQI